MNNSESHHQNDTSDPDQIDYYASRIRLQAITTDPDVLAGFERAVLTDDFDDDFLTAIVATRIEPEGLRQFELQRHMLLAQYNMSRLIDRLVEARLVRRQPCPQDGRGQVIYVTEKGRALIDAMWPAYRAAIAAHFGDRLDERQAEVLAGILESLRSGP